MLIQIGYVGAMLFVSPLGDARDRKILILKTCVASALCLIGMSLSPNLWVLAATSLALGISTATPQLIVPLAASLSEPERRGRVVGTVLGGLMAGILLGRVFSGALVGMLGWRGVLAGGGLLTFGLALILLGDSYASGGPLSIACSFIKGGEFLFPEDGGFILLPRPCITGAV